MLTVKYDYLTKKHINVGAKPRYFVDLSKVQKYIISLDKSCIYSYGYQHEWNRLWNTIPHSSILTSFLPYDKSNSVHICWRYNSDSLEFEIAPIYVVEGVTMFPEAGNILHALPNQLIDISISFNNETKTSVTALRNKSTGEMTITKSDFFDYGFLGWGRKDKPSVDLDFPHSYEMTYHYA